MRLVFLAIASTPSLMAAAPSQVIPICVYASPLTFRKVAPIGGRARTRAGDFSVKQPLTVADANVTINEGGTRRLQFCEVPRNPVAGRYQRRRNVDGADICVCGARREKPLSDWSQGPILRPDLSTNGALTIPRYRVEPRRCPSPVCLLHSTTSESDVLESRRLGKSPSAGAWAD